MVPQNGMEPLGGFEPPVTHLQGRCLDRARLQRHICMRDEGFEPPNGHLEGGSAIPGYSNPAFLFPMQYWRGIGELHPSLRMDGPVCLLIHQCPFLWSRWADLNRHIDGNCWHHIIQSSMMHFIYSRLLSLLATARWYPRPDSNRRRRVQGSVCLASTLREYGLVELAGFEPTTLGMQHQVSSDWYYSPM